MGRKRRPPQPATDPRVLLAASILEFLLFLAVWAWVLHGVASGLASLVGTDLESAWEGIGSAFGVEESTLRLVFFTIVHVITVILAAPILQRVSREADKGVAEAWRHLQKARHPVLRNGLGVLGFTATAALFVAFVLQPTLVPLRVDGRAWVERAANLVDGEASASIVDSVVGLVRRFTADPVTPTDLVEPSAFDATLASATVPLMDRWDTDLLEAADGDRKLFAQTKAFMWVESGGRQFAVSSTGCAGLMQFCASTAQRRPFGTIFGVGQVAACGCDDCSVPRAVQIALETDPDAVRAHADTFPCDLSDARFEAVRSIRAGVAFVRELGDGVGGHLPLMYIGYNAGPRVARALYQKLGPQDEITVDELRPHLAAALRPYHGSRAEGRANGLLDVHLPKLLEAYERWAP